MTSDRDDAGEAPCVVCGHPTAHRWMRAGEMRPRCPDREACERRRQERDCPPPRKE